MTYYRPRVPSWLWLTALCAVVFVVTIMAGRQLIANVRETERTRVLSEATLQTKLVFPAEVVRWKRELDSLRAITTMQDSAVQRSTEAARLALVRLAYLKAHPDSTPPETVQVWTGAVVNACTTMLSDCERFRASAVLRFAAADSIHHADSVATHALAVSHVVVSDSLADAKRALARTVSRSTLWKNRAEYAVTGAATGALLCLVFCR